MGRAKEIELRIIPASIANPFVRKHHYSGKIVNNSKVHFGAFLDGKLHGVMSYGSSTDKSKMLGLVEGTGWNEFLELNRMAFDDYLPRNSESRCIAQSIRMIKKTSVAYQVDNFFRGRLSMRGRDDISGKRIYFDGDKTQQEYYSFPERTPYRTNNSHRRME